MPSALRLSLPVGQAVVAATGNHWHGESDEGTVTVTADSRLTHRDCTLWLAVPLAVSGTGVTGTHRATASGSLSDSD